MTGRPIMDAGPGINFFSIHKERLLFATLGALSIPETVREEIQRKSKHDHRFSAASGVLAKAPESLLNILSDDVTDELAGAVERICRIPFHQRLLESKDLGETMVVAHAAIAAETGENVIVLIDDGGGRRLAASEARRLDRMRHAGKQVGTISLIGTVTVLERAAGGAHLPDRAALRTLYQRLRGLDDGVPPLASTNLMDLSCWSRQK
ncbi:hypothetical protein DUY81_00895 [Acidipropionibacterium acidipropionici]|uniref:Uncharacterized protein n=2 Tax=Acidipropionibacterium acidipropionici TaxID=1748 RepID=A0AAC8YFZ6_9ACTN|nr:hypothetical protein AXH35_10855 [Acidipropionibacterium acidipropionici]AOZ47329.1 hypothetical protein A8L58_12295 [Acidipropionibacterium acidipropionici]AZP36564.1 hypothetical protein DUY81_00895 [Acidipropionibacterium acidipropionici]